MKRKFLWVLLVAVVAFSTGCGDSYETSADSGSNSSFYQAEGAGWEDSNSFDYNEEKAAAVEEVSDSATEESGGLDGYDMSRKIVYTSNVSIESKKFDEDIASIQKLVNSSGGYFESTSQSGSLEYGNRYASFTARIPSKNYNDFMNSVGSIGSLTQKSENVEDITSSYVDVQARLKSLDKKLKRLQELEDNAETIEDLLAIEDRINSVQYDIENYTAQKRLYDDKVDYCTVSINVDEVATYSEVRKDTAWNRFAEAFTNSFAGFIAFLQWLVIAFIYVLPYALVALVILIIVLVVTRKKRAELKNKKKVVKENAQGKNQNKEYSGPQYNEEDN